MKNNYKKYGDITEIYLKCKGKTFTAIIDTKDLPIVDSFPNTWQLVLGYVVGFSDRNNGKKATVWRMHRVITNCPDNRCVDHINHNKLDNQSKNLRIVTQAQNHQNYKGEKESESGMRGVTWDNTKRKWNVQVRVNNKNHYIGHYKNLEDAKKVVQEARLKLMPFSPEATNGMKYTGHAEKIKEQNKVKSQANNKTSGIRGVSWSKQHEKWRVDAMKNGKSYYSYHENLNEAIKSRNNFIQLLNAN